MNSTPDPRPITDETSFLAGYDPSRYPHPSLAVDVVLLTVTYHGELRVMLVERTEQPGLGKMALPGGFVGIDESLDAAANRVLDEKAGLDGIFAEQLYTFGAPGRDPRTRVVSVAYYALVPGGWLSTDHPPRAGTAARLVVPWEGETGGAISAVDENGEELELAFDHADMIGMAVKRLRGKLWYAPVAFELVPESFSLLELRQVYEAILGRPLNKDSFRQRITASGLVEPTGETRTGSGRFRPPALYRFVEQA